MVAAVVMISTIITATTPPTMAPVLSDSEPGGGTVVEGGKDPDPVNTVTGAATREILQQ